METNYLLNVSSLSINWDDTWVFTAIQTDEEWKKEYYEKIIAYRRKKNETMTDTIMESSGRIIIFIPRKQNSSHINDKIISLINEVKEELQDNLGIDLTLEKIDPLSYDEGLMIQAIKNALGGIVEQKLKELNFEKLASKGSIGRYYHPQFSQKNEIRDLKVALIRAMDFTLLVTDIHSKKAYLAVDLKTEVQGTETLNDVYKRNKNKPLEEWPKDLRTYKIRNERRLPLDFDETSHLELIDIQPYPKVKDKPIYTFKKQKYYGKPLETFMTDAGIIKTKETIIGVFKNKDPKSKDPNKEYLIPATYLVKSITNSSIVNSKYKNEFHRFSKPNMKERRKVIQDLFDFLKNNGITQGTITFKGENPKIAFPSVKTHHPDEYGKIPNLMKTGVEKWGNLRAINIYYDQDSSYVEKHVESFKKELQKQLQNIAKKTKVQSPKITMKFLSPKPENIKAILSQTTTPKESTLYLFIESNRDKKQRYNYKKLKTWFTQEQGLPIQYMKFKTIKKAFQTVRTLIPQLLAKTGGLPYSLYPEILDKTLIIGLDKFRDSASTKPSASAGIAAVTPKGVYVAGASTPLDSTKHDKIDVDKLAPELLESLKSTYKDKLEYIVILRDGSPETCKEEIKPWEKHIQEYNMKFVFFAARKENPYRVFPVTAQEKQLQLPVILHGEPLPKNDFLVVTANAFSGTAKPVVYTLMKNTTSFTEQEIITKVIPQVISMSMLSWESPKPTSQPLPLHYADKLAAFTQLVEQKWRSDIKSPMFI